MSNIMSRSDRNIANSGEPQGQSRLPNRSVQQGFTPPDKVAKIRLDEPEMVRSSSQDSLVYDQPVLKRLQDAKHAPAGGIETTRGGALGAMQRAKCSADPDAKSVAACDLKSVSDLSDARWSGVDVSAIPRKSALRGFAHKGGGIACKRRFALSFGYNASGGVLSSVAPIDPSVNTTEWTAVQALYDQYRVRNAYLLFGSANAVTGGASDFGLVLAYDPTDTVALTSVREGCEYSDHKQFWPIGAGGALNSVYADYRGKPLEYSPTLVGGKRSPTASVPTRDEWSSTASPTPYGYVKTYAANLVNATGPALAGIMLCDVEFRNLT